MDGSAGAVQYLLGAEPESSWGLSRISTIPPILSGVQGRSSLPGLDSTEPGEAR